MLGLLSGSRQKFARKKALRQERAYQESACQKRSCAESTAAEYRHSECSHKDGKTIHPCAGLLDDNGCARGECLCEKAVSRRCSARKNTAKARSARGHSGGRRALRPWARVIGCAGAMCVGVTGVVAGPSVVHADVYWQEGMDSLPGVPGIYVDPHDGGSGWWFGSTNASAPWEFCVQAGANNSGADVVSVSDLPSSTPRVPGLELTVGQMAWLLRAYENNMTPMNAGALNVLAHANFEQPPSASGVYSGWRPASASESVQRTLQVAGGVPEMMSIAKAMVAQAKSSAVAGYQGGISTGEAMRHGSYTGFAVRSDTGTYIPGVAVTATIIGPAVWDETSSNTVTVTSRSDGEVTKTWSAIGNGEIRIQYAYSDPSGSLTLVGRQGTQSTVRNDGVAREVHEESETYRVVYDFQPLGVSSAVKLTDDSGVFRDTFIASADPAYGDGTWLTQAQVGMGDRSESAVPVVYRASAYKVGSLELPAFHADGLIPQDAVLIGTTKVTAVGSGELEASFKADEPGWYVVVWSVEKKDQGEFADAIHADWSDGWAQHDETVSYRWEANVDSSLSIRETKSGLYLVDDVWVSGLPSDHGEFMGGMKERFTPDTPDMAQKLLFFPEGEAVTDENITAGELIGQITFPARNGFHASLGSSEFAIKYDDTGAPVPGTYVFVTSFAGDDRVKPFVSSVEDKTEQYVVEAVPPILKTTATDTVDGDQLLEPVNPASITDTVCDVNKTLKPGTSYEIVTRLYIADGSPLLDGDGQPVSKTTDFTPKTPDDCAVITIEFDGSALAGQQVVVFEDVLRDGQTIATHHDLHDKDQTVRFTNAPLPTTGMSAGMLGGLGVGISAAGVGAFVVRRNYRLQSR